MKKVYVLLANGFELIEAMTPVDVLRRAGLEVKTVSINYNLDVISAQKVTVQADITIKDEDITSGDMLILPGGYPGYIHLSESSDVVDIVKSYAKNYKYIGAICGAPTLLAKHNILPGKNLTCHSSVKDEMSNYKYSGKNVEKDGYLITSIGAGKSLDFAFALLESLVDDEAVRKVKMAMEICE